MKQHPASVSRIMELRAALAAARDFPWQRQDRERIAALYLVLLECDALADAEHGDAFKYLKMACHAANHATGNIEKLFVYLGAARRLLAVCGENRDLEALGLCLAEATGLARIERDPWPALRVALALRRRLRQRDPADQEMLRQSERLAWALSLYLARRDRLGWAFRLAVWARRSINERRARRRVRTAIQRTSEQVQADKIAGLLLVRCGRREEGLALLEGALDRSGAPDGCRDIAWMLWHGGEQAAARRWLVPAAAAFQEARSRNGRIDLKTATLLVLAAAADDRLDEAFEVFRLLGEELAVRQTRFVFADNLEGFLGKYESVYAVLVDLAWRHGRPDLAREAIAAAFWTTALPPGDGEPAGFFPQEGIEGDSPRLQVARERLLAAEERPVPLPDLEPELDEATLQLLLFQSAEACYCLYRERGGAGWERRLLARERLLELVDGLREAALDGWYGPALADLAAEGFRRALFGEAVEARMPGKQVLLTGAYPFSIVPWWLVLRGHAPVFRPALGGGPSGGRPPESAGLLALTEDGTTLPMAVREHRLLGELFPECTRLVADRGNAQAVRSAVLAALPACRIFHFAGHGYHDILPERSGLVVAGDPIRSEGLVVLDTLAISRLDLRGLALVFLNSCSSGFGRAFAGGVESHPAAAFLRAGARALVVSLVPVPDGGSAAFMEIFYRRLADDPLADPAAVFDAVAGALDRPCPYLFVSR